MQGGRRKQHFLVWTVFKRFEFPSTVPTLVFTQMKRKSYLSSTEISENYHPVDEVDNDNDDDIDIDNDNDNFKMIIFRENHPVEEAGCLHLICIDT